jgi:hypothetical protein
MANTVAMVGNSGDLVQRVRGVARRASEMAAEMRAIHDEFARCGGSSHIEPFFATVEDVPVSRTDLPYTYGQFMDAMSALEVLSGKTDGIPGMAAVIQGRLANLEIIKG